VCTRRFVSLTIYVRLCVSELSERCKSSKNTHTHTERVIIGKMRSLLNFYEADVFVMRVVRRGGRVKMVHKDVDGRSSVDRRAVLGRRS